MATTTFEKPVGSEIETLKSDVQTLNNNLATKQNKFEWINYNAADIWPKAAHDAIEELAAEECKTQMIATANGYHFIAMLQKSDPVRAAIYVNNNGNIAILFSNTSGATYVYKEIGIV